ncbi:putative bifunctional diguanylate cyclase/phosphodiesterase [Melissospora conviva]|uniref:putative bifunctional diguanylate cyclase/phosphodiesterase n=1 Tax=Melissospora conviva TaxID=3388432 RepID=UPI003B77A725
MNPLEHHDNQTDQAVRTLVGLVVAAAGTATVLALVIAIRQPAQANDLVVLLTITSMIAICTTMKAGFRLRSAHYSVTWSETAIVLGLFVAPTHWVILCTAVGVAAAAGIARLSRLKTAFSIGKNTLVATAAGLALAGYGSGPDTLAHLLAAATVGYLVAVVADELITLQVIALVSRTPLPTLLRTDWDLRLLGTGFRYLATLGTLVVLFVDHRLLPALPALVLSLHLAYSHRVRGRAEQQAWQRLARTTDALNVIDLDRVLTTAVNQAGELFSADQVEIELTSAERTVQGSGGRISYDGPSARLVSDAPAQIETRLRGVDGETDVGILRLRFHRPVALSERERYTLRTFAAALCTAVCNAQAYAELARAADGHAHAAGHDALTGLPNRRALLERGERMLDRRHGGGVIALLLIDLNHFKEVNDTLGHTAGDQVLVQVAERLRAAAGPADLVARLGGDEFAVLFVGLPAPALAAVRADVVLAGLREPFLVDGIRVGVEASGGIAAGTGAGGIDELLRRADVAMYQAKRAGQRICTYAPAQDTADLGRLWLGGDLARAVDNREFIVEFQPIVDLGTGDLIAAEALTRWRHPVHGAIEPLRFIATVERSALLPAFTAAVLDQALDAVRQWREAGFDAPVAVNVSPRSLLDTGFPDAVHARLLAHGVAPGSLYLELTETLALSRLEVVDEVLARLRALGVRLALDDFGTGYSSLSLLSRIPVHELKIDRSFVAVMESSVQALAVVRSTVDLGRSLGLTVVAEGVESERQRQTLWQLGCAAGQGHLFGRSMPAERFLAVLQRGTDGHRGRLAAALHEGAPVIRLPPRQSPEDGKRHDNLPNWPA